jgi:hypothetical protein
LGWRLLLLLGRPSLELLLLRGLLLLELVLLSRITSVLWLLGLLLLLPKSLRLAREASILLLHGSSPKARWLRAESALKAALLPVWLLLLLLAILRLPRSGAVAAP